MSRFIPEHLLQRIVSVWPTVSLTVSLASLAWLPLPAQALDLLQSYEAALLEDAEFQTARAVAAGGRELLPLARAQLMPVISANASRMQNDLTTETENSLRQPVSYNSKYVSKNYSISLRQPLYRPQLLTGYQQAKLKVDSVEAAFDKAGQDLAVRVAGAYFNVLLAEETLRQVTAQAQAIEVQLAAAQRALEVGHGTRTDVDDAQARLDMNGSQHLGARQQIDQARHELETLINRPATVLAPVNRERLELLSMQPAQLDAWIARALDTSPELRDMQARVEAARYEVERARAGHKPTLDLIVQRSINDSDSVTSVGSRYDNSQIGVQLAVPLFAGGYVNAQVRQAQAALEENERRLEALKRRLATQVRKEFQGVEEGILKVRALEQAERSADQAVFSNKKGFQAGTRSRIDILNAEENRRNVLLELTRERLLFILSRARLLALSGTLDHDAMVTMNRWLGE